MFYLLGFISTIFFANWLIGNAGDCAAYPCTIPVWLNIYAPSGVLAIAGASRCYAVPAGIRWRGCMGI